MPLKVWQRSNGQADKDAQEPQKMPLIPRDLVAGCHEAHSLQIQLGNVPDVVHQGEEPQEEGEDGLLSLIQVLGKMGVLFGHPLGLTLINTDYYFLPLNLL